MRTSFTLALLAALFALSACGRSTLLPLPTERSTSSGSGGSGGQSCEAPACPVTAPVLGAPCPCLEGSSCDYNLCASTGNHTVAACKEGAWQVSVTKCAVPCGPMLECPAGEVCVDVQNGFSSAYSCAADPCGGPVTCACAASLCGDPQSFGCFVDATPNTVHCSCLVCDG